MWNSAKLEQKRVKRSERRQSFYLWLSHILHRLHTSSNTYYFYGTRPIMCLNVWFLFSRNSKNIYLDPILDSLLALFYCLLCSWSRFRSLFSFSLFFQFWLTKETPKRVYTFVWMAAYMLSYSRNLIQFC